MIKFTMSHITIREVVKLKSVPVLLEFIKEVQYEIA